MPSADGSFLMIDGARFPAAVRCVAHRKNGDQCKRYATRGSQVCFHHGAGSPNVQRAAEEAVRTAIAELRIASPAAVTTLVANLSDEDSRVRSNAADLILRRTVREAVSVQVEGNVSMTIKTPGQILTERLAKLAARQLEVEEEQAGYPIPPTPGSTAVVIDADAK